MNLPSKILSILPQNKKIFKQVLGFLICCISLGKDALAQPCNGTWLLQRPLSHPCFNGQWVGWQTGGVDPAGCPVNPVYVGTQTNTFTFSQPVSAFSIDFRGFDGTVQCPRIELRVNGNFYHLTTSNVTDIPNPACTGAFSGVTITSDGYITIGTLTGPSTQGRITITNVNATSVSVSTNDGNGSTFSTPFDCLDIVPVELVNFRGKQLACQIELDWQTGTEYNLKNFEIEMSEDGLVYKSIKSVTPKGSNSYYSFSAPHYSTAYYRLKITDQDRTYRYSEVLHFSNICNIEGYVLKPNPATTTVELSGVEKNTIIVVSDILGRKIFNLTAAQNQIIDIESLQPGIYILNVIKNNIMVATLKLVKK